MEALTTAIPTPRSVLLKGDDPEAKREEIRRYFHDTFDAYEALFEVMVSDESFYRRAAPLRPPLIFYYGHTAVFFINKLVLGKLLERRINPKFESIFAIGVDEMSWDDLNEAHYEWPKPEEVRAYRQQARAAIDELISTMPIALPIGWESPFWVIMMGIEHERIHLETSSVLIRQLPLDLVQKHPAWAISEERGSEAPTNALLDVPGGEITLGKRRDSGLYGWDNEYGLLEETVEPFKASKFLVSNGEFLEFVEAGGYASERFWTEEGWSWATFDQRGHPRFWRKREDGSWGLRCMLEEIAMPWNWPVECNYLEAKAFCNWKAEQTGRPVRLPTEAEWYKLLDHSGLPDVWDWATDQAPGNFNLDVAASPTPVDKFAQGQGFYDVMGNVWQHTETPIAGYPGFEVHPLYDDFSTPTFDTKHNLIKGGSWIATGNEATRESRYAFRRHFYQHAGFRYIESEVPVVIRDDSYETDAEVVPYCEQHYGAEHFGVANYPERIAQIALANASEGAKKRACYIGCKVGRGAFELAVEFDHVTGLDATARHIRIGVQMQDKGYTHWQIADEGEIVSFHEARLAEFGLEQVREKVEFLQSDPSNMKELYRDYDLIVVDNVLDRTYNPRHFLQDLRDRLNHGGLLLISSRNDWDEAHTRKENWLGGYKEAGENVSTLDSIAECLGSDFRQIESPRDIEFVLKRNARSFEHAIAQVSLWRKD